MKTENKAIRLVLSKLLGKEIKSVNTALLQGRDLLAKYMRYHTGNQEDLGTFVGAEKFRNFFIDCIDNKDIYKKIDCLPELEDMLKEELNSDIQEGHCFYELPKTVYLDTVDNKKWYTNSLLVQIEHGFISITYPALTEEGCNFGNLCCKKDSFLKGEKISDLFENDAHEVIGQFTSLEQIPSLQYLFVVGLYLTLKK